MKSYIVMVTPLDELRLKSGNFITETVVGADEADAVDRWLRDRSEPSRWDGRTLIVTNGSWTWVFDIQQAMSVRAVQR